MVYICDKCNFIFRRFGEVVFCPNCEKTAIREATEQEQEEYLKTLLKPITPNASL